MKTQTSLLACPRALVTSILLLALSSLPPVQAQDGAIPALLDDFSNAKNTTAGLARLVVDDASVGGTSRLRQAFSDGVLTVEGEITPARGQPGWTGLVLLLTPSGGPADLSRYEGVRLRVRVDKGNLAVSANSSEVDNFDYHSKLIPRSRADFEEVRIPFRDMKRAWSEQTTLRPETVGSISLTVVGMQAGPFAYAIDEIGFY